MPRPNKKKKIKSEAKTYIYPKDSDDEESNKNEHKIDNNSNKFANIILNNKNTNKLGGLNDEEIKKKIYSYSAADLISDFLIIIIILKKMLKNSKGTMIL